MTGGRPSGLPPFHVFETQRKEVLMKVFGAILIVLGALALAYGGFTYTKRDKVLDVGPIEASVDKKERVPISPIVGGLAVVAGLALVFAGGRRRAV
jgi:hypothetical protein